MQEITRITPVGIDPRALGSYAPRMTKKEDHGPYCLFSPGEPVHRVDCKDSVPHIYPMQVVACTSWGAWNYISTASDNVSITATNADGQNVYFNPKYAGGIKEDICEGPGNYGYLGVVSLAAFEGIELEKLDIDGFNSLIMPEPLWYGNDDLPPQHRAWFATRYPQIEETVSKHGAMAMREMFLAQALQKVKDGGVDSSLRLIYSRAIVEMQSAAARFKKWADAYMASQDREVKDQKSDKGTYDDRDARLQWLTARKPVDVAQTPIFQVQMPESQAQADVERKECSECGELIAVRAKVCRYCNARFEAASVEPEIKRSRARLPKAQTESLTDEPVKVEDSARQ